ncbi:MAG: UBP-type zinc finger domain-containing protein [Terriglobales bacterium]
MANKCTHLDQIKVTETNTRECPECVKLGDTWVHLRMCLVCGQVGCCDSSKNKHATKHFHKTKHPVMRSIEPGESWVWCYVDEIEAAELAA